MDNDKLTTVALEAALAEYREACFLAHQTVRQRLKDLARQLQVSVFPASAVAYLLFNCYSGEKLAHCLVHAPMFQKG